MSFLYHHRSASDDTLVWDEKKEELSSRMASYYFATGYIELFLKGYHHNIAVQIKQT